MGHRLDPGQSGSYPPAPTHPLSLLPLHPPPSSPPHVPARLSSRKEGGFHQTAPRLRVEHLGSPRLLSAEFGVPQNIKDEGGGGRQWESGVERPVWSTASQECGAVWWTSMESRPTPPESGWAEAGRAGGRTQRCGARGGRTAGRNKTSARSSPTASPVRLPHSAHQLC